LIVAEQVRAGGGQNLAGRLFLSAPGGKQNPAQTRLRGIKAERIG
jgi:hypothetical protein